MPDENTDALFVAVDRGDKTAVVQWIKEYADRREDAHRDLRTRVEALRAQWLLRVARENNNAANLTQCARQLSRVLDAPEGNA